MSATFRDAPELFLRLQPENEAGPVIYDMRTYALRPGEVASYVALFGAKGLPLLSRYATLVGYFHTETGGRLNRIVHVWRYEGRAERLAQRAALMAEPDWRSGFLPEAMPHLLEQHSDLLRLAAFSPDPMAWAVAHPRLTTAAPRIYELRTYRLTPGSVPAMLAAYKRHAALFARHLDLVAYWTADGGDLGRVVHLWAYADEADRDARQAALAADPEFTAGFLAEAGPLLLGAESTMLVPASYSPLT